MKKMCVTAAFLLFVFSTPTHAHPLAWREVAPGLVYAKVSVNAVSSPGLVHAFRIDLAHYRIDTLLAKDYGANGATAREMATRAKAVLAINGGFFSPTLEPLGLRVQSGRQRAPLKDTSWWGIFFVNGSTAKIAARNEFTPTNNVQMAVQAGPRLVVDGMIPALKEGVAERSAIGITRDGKIVIAVTEQTPLATRSLAELFRKSATDGGFNCANALNLDGGGSSQLYIKTRGFTLDVPGITPVTDAVAVFVR